MGIETSRVEELQHVVLGGMCTACGILYVLGMELLPLRQ